MFHVQKYVAKWRHFSIFFHTISDRVENRTKCDEINMENLYLLRADQRTDGFGDSSEYPSLKIIDSIHQYRVQIIIVTPLYNERKYPAIPIHECQCVDQYFHVKCADAIISNVHHRRSLPRRFGDASRNNIEVKISHTL